MMRTKKQKTTHQSIITTTTTTTNDNNNMEQVVLNQFTKNQTEVALKITKHLFSKDGHKDKNIVFSPLSIHVVLSIIGAGSKGDTLDQILSFLNFQSIHHLNTFAHHLATNLLSDPSPEGGPHLCSASAAWVDLSITLKPSFMKLLHTCYNAALASLDFQTKGDEATNEINSWVKKETNGLIEEIILRESIDNLTRLIFANALYFKGTWFEKFDESSTRDCDFHLLNGTKIKVPFMTNRKIQFINVFPDFKVVGLPYAQGTDDRDFSMYIFLPNATEGLPALLEKLTSEPGFLESTLPLKLEELDCFMIPKFNISFDFGASDVLKELGLVLPFLGGDLTEMVDSTSPMSETPLQVSDIFHKSLIEVNEEGTEAVAVTESKITNYFSCSGIEFIADHPFIFIIREDTTETILFIGQVTNPLAE